MLQQCHKGVRQYFVRAVADKHLIGGDSMERGNTRAQPIRARIRIQPQGLGSLCAHRLQYLRTRSVGILIGVELDQIGQFGLLARHVGRQAAHYGAPILAHLVVKRYSAERACACKPSP